MPADTSKAAIHEDTNSPQVFVWDILVRIGHWLIVVLFFVAYFTEDDLLTLHSWAGYGIALYVVVRVIWDFAGPKRLCTVKSGNLFEPRAEACPGAGRSVILVFHECYQTAMENWHAERPG